MPSVPRVTIRVAATSPGLIQVMDAFEFFQRTRGLNDAAAWPVLVALDEVLSNVVRHAYAGRPDGELEVSFAIEGDRLTVTVVDDGPPLDPRTLPAPDTTSSLNDREPGGLGVYLVKSLMDDVDYARVDGRNQLVLTHRIAPAAGRES